MRWPGFRKVRSQVCKRLGRRLGELGFEDLTGYRSYLQSNAEEWRHLDSICRITISRFYRDRSVFEAMETSVLPTLAAAASRRGDGSLTAWSCGCASGEEAYTLAILWNLRTAARYPGMRIEITATDADPHLLDRARAGIYPTGSVRDLPEDLLRASFDAEGARLRVRDELRTQIVWRCQDVRRAAPPGSFDLVLCRNLVLTYFDEGLQHEVMARVLAALRTGGALVVGSHETLPATTIACEPWDRGLPVYRRLG
jgi:chemotaxis protein methyltransferase CheR